jgi:hypothetical protein
MALGSTQPLTEISTRNLPGGVKSGRYVGLTILTPSMCRMSETVRASISRNPRGLHGLYRNNLTFTFPSAIKQLNEQLIFVIFYETRKLITLLTTAMIWSLP